MAKTPQELLNRDSQSNLLKVLHAEKIIDCALTRDYMGDVFEAPPIFAHNLNHDCCLELRRRYEAAGWKMTWTCDETFYLIKLEPAHEKSK